MAYKITQHRRGTYEEWLELDVAPYEGELVIVEFDNNVRKCKIGDGKTPFSGLPYLSDWIVAEFEDKLEALQELTGTELLNVVAEIDQKIANAYDKLTNEIAVLRSDVGTQISTLSSDVESLASDLSKVDGVVKTLVEPAVGELDAKYSEELSQISEQHNADVAALSTAVENKATELTSYIDAAVAKNASEFTSALLNAKTDLAIDYVDKISDAEDRLQSAINTNKSTLQQHAAVIEDIQSNVSDLASSVETRIDEKITASENSTNTSIEELRESIGQVYLVIENLKNEQDNLPEYDMGPSNSPDSDGLVDIVEQLDTLQYKVTLLERGASATTTDIQKINIELTSIIASLTGVLEQQKESTDAFTKSISALDARSSKADADIITAMTLHNEEVSKDLAKLTADDILLYQTLYKIKDDLTKKIDVADTAIQKELTDDIARVNQNISDVKDKLNTRLTNAQTGMVESLTDATAELTRKINNIEKTNSEQITLNTNAINELSTTVVTNKAELSRLIETANAGVISNKTNIANNSSAINQVSLALDNKTAAIEAGLGTLSIRIDNQVASVESRLQAQINETGSVVEQQAVALSVVQDTISDLLEEVDHKIDTKIFDSKAATDASLLELKATVKQIKDTIAQAEFGSCDLSGIYASLGRFADQLADLQADDILLYQIIYRIRDELLASIASTAETARADLADYQNEVLQNFDDISTTFDAKLAKEKTYLDNKLNGLSARIEKETNALYVTHSSKIAENKTAIANLTTTVVNNKNEAKQDLATTNERLTKTVERVSSNQSTISKVDKDLKDNVSLINLNIDTLTKNLAAQDARISGLMALEPGSTTGDAAYADICNGYDGTVHKTPGDAVRAVGNDLKALGNSVKTLEDNLSQYIGSQAVDGLHYDINGEVGLGQPYMLYLKAGEEILQDSGVQVIGGSGGSGGGGASKLKISYLQGESSEIKAVAGTKITIGFIFEGEDSSGDTIFSASATWRIDGVIVERGTVKYGENYFDATKYIKTGTTKIHLTVNDDNGGTVTKSWTVQSIELTLTSDFNDKRKYSLDDRVIFSFVPTGAVKKTAIFKLDGIELPSKEIGKDISGTAVSYELPAQVHGAHLLEVYLEADINNTIVKTDPPIYKDIIWYDSESDIPVIGTSVKNLEVKQYSTTNIIYTVYDPKNETPVVNIEVDGTVVSTQTVLLNKDYGDTPTAVYPYAATTPGEHTIKLICGNTEKAINVYAENIDINISPVTTGLAFDFNPVGRNNNDANRLWSHGNIRMTVSNNFDWVNGGYIPDEADGPCFCIKAGSTATIDYKLFANEAKVSGKEVKLIFKTRNVANPEAVFLSCLDNTTDRDHVGVKMGIHNASIYGKDVSLDLAYSEEDTIEFEFNISSDTEAVPMIMGYEDGVPSRPVVYNTKTSSFQQNSAKVITLGSPDCDLYIYRFKVFEVSLSASEILRNFIADARTTDEMIDRYNRNQIYDENQNLTAEALAEKCPWLRIYKISAPHFTNSKSDKVSNTTIQQIYLDGDQKLDNWVCYNAQHSGQGTSSNNYGAAGRNLDFIMNKSNSYFILGDGSRPDDNKITLTRNSIPVAYLNAKVNIASSNNLTNAILANRYDKYNPYKRPFADSQLVSTGEKDNNGNEIKLKPKDTMEFHNCVIFIQETDQDLTTHREFADTDWHFYAIGNIGDSKKTDNTRLTDPEDPYECCVEIMDVGLPLSGFPRETVRDAMAYELDDKGNKLYKWATTKNLEKGILLEKQEDGSYVVTSDTTLLLDENGYITKTYYVDFLEHDDFSEDYTYGWRYISDDENADVVDTCKQAWINFYRFVTTSSDEEFKSNLKDYFVVDSALYYYLFTTRYCMVDNRAKNTFWHYSKTSDLDVDGNPIRKWDLCWDYDNDTSLGLNNFGKQLYRYGLEDIDADGAGKEVFRQSDSLFFCRIRDLFNTELKEMYKTLESADAWNASAFLNQCDEWQEQFPEELWRVDIERKYIRTYNSSFINGSGDKQFLTNMCNGRMKYHRRQWERSQELYMASKYQTPIALGDKYHANFRAAQFKKEELENLVIPTNYQFTLTPYAYMYLNVYYNSGSPFSVRITDANINTPVVVPYPRDEADIINIGSASAIRDFGDLAPVYADTVSVANAARIKQLKIGDATAGYENKALSSFTVVDENGNGAQQLEKLILTNVSGLKTSQDFEALVNLKELYAFGTNIPSVTFAQGGKLEYAELPAVTILSLKSLKYLADAGLKLTGVTTEDGTIAYTSIVDLTIEDCPQITALKLLEACPNVVNVKLDNIKFGTKTYEYFEKNIFKLRGFEGELSDAKLTGSVHFESLNGEQFNEIKTRYPNLSITYDDLTSNIKFIDTDKVTPLVDENYTRNTENKIDCISLDIVPNTVTEKTATPEFSYELFGWSVNKDEPVLNYEHLIESSATLAEEADRKKYNEGMLTNIEGNRTFYPVFKANRRSYLVQFIGADTEVLQELDIPYGSLVPEEVYASLLRKDTSDYDAPGIKVFIGWEPKPEATPVIEPTTFEAQFADDELVLADIEYTLTESTLAITKCLNMFNDAIKVPSRYTKDGKDYTVTSIGGFNGYTNLELITLPDTLVKFGTKAFHECINLREIVIPLRVSELSQDAFSRCDELTKVFLQGDVTILGATCFAWCYKLADVNLKEGLAEIRSYVFYQCALTDVVIPSTVHTIGDNAFGGMSSLKTVIFKEYLNDDGTIRLPDIHAKAFMNDVVAFNVPWSKDDHIAKYGKSTFGAAVAFDEAFNFNYKEGNS